ncbi:MAG: PKD domain-containing protein, partial [Thermoplasmata archaeon]|nr:PKD domain-containing protein [Thermoplasmata archaeon]
MKGKALFIAGIMIIVAFMNMNTMAWAPLSADFTWQPENPNDLQEVHFIDNSSGNIVIWVWYFGDGNSSTDVNPYHKYADNGSYNVTLIVISAYGNMDKITKQINISNVPPHAIIKVDAVNNKSNVNFSSLSYDDDGSIVNYTWQFGDGSTATGKTVSHIYANDGIYNINLTVKDNDGAENETNTSIMVDTTSPVTSYNLSCSGWCNGSVDVTFNATDNLSGVSKTYYKIDDGEWKEYNGSFTVTSEGIHKIY